MNLVKEKKRRTAKAPVGARAARGGKKWSPGLKHGPTRIFSIVCDEPWRAGEGRCQLMADVEVMDWASPSVTCIARDCSPIRGASLQSNAAPSDGHLVLQSEPSANPLARLSFSPGSTSCISLRLGPSGEINKLLLQPSAAPEVSTVLEVLGGGEQAGGGVHEACCLGACGLLVSG